MLIRVSLLFYDLSIKAVHEIKVSFIRKVTDACRDCRLAYETRLHVHSYAVGLYTCVRNCTCISAIDLNTHLTDINAVLKMTARKYLDVSHCLMLSRACLISPT